MSAHPQSLGHRIMATGIAAALALTGVITAAGVANAQENRPEYGNINTANKGTIHLHKRESGSQGQTTGSVFEKTAAGKPVQGVTFTYHKVSGLDLLQPANWEKLKDITVPAGACDVAASADQGTRKLAGYQLDTGVQFPAVTDVEGHTSVSNLVLGAYLICETAAPTTVKKKAAPFLVTVPYFAPEKGWIYEVHAYPKNTVIEPATKGVAPVTEYGINHADQVTFTITAKVPSLSQAVSGSNAKDEYFKYFVLGDSLHSGYENGKIKSVQLADSADGGNAQDINAGHYVKVDSETQPNTTPHWLSVTFNKAGLTELRNNAANKYIIVTITAQVKNVGGTSDAGKLPNTGYVMIDTLEKDQPVPPDPEDPGYNPPQDPGNPPTPKVPGGGTPPPWTETNKVATLWGQAKLLKHSTDPQKTPLQGAQFEIYHAKVQDENCEGTQIDDQKSNPISIGTKSVFDSNNAGIVEVVGLFIDQAVGVGSVEPAFSKNHRCYVFKEVKAPLGYVLPQGDQALKGVKVEPGQKTGHNVELSNTPVSVPELPITGASGTVIATVVGTSLLLLAVGAVLVRRRREAIKA